MVGIGPKDELEGMMAAQLVAAHNAAMECYRGAMIGEQSFEGRRENLAQANKLSRTYAALVEALNRHRGSHGENRSSSPLGSARDFKHLEVFGLICVQAVSRLELCRGRRALYGSRNERTRERVSLSPIGRSPSSTR